MNKLFSIEIFRKFLNAIRKIAEQYLLPGWPLQITGAMVGLRLREKILNINLIIRNGKGLTERFEKKKMNEN